jgi:hypothetical protein
MRRRGEKRGIVKGEIREKIAYINREDIRTTEKKEQREEMR